MKAEQKPVGRVTAVVPLRSALHGKSRLDGTISRSQRMALISGMLAHVAGALRTASSVDRTIVAAGDDSAVQLARSMQLASVRDPRGGGGLNVALRSIVDRLPRDHHLLVVVPDLPTLAADEVDELAASPARICIAPTSDGGTGGLALGPRARICLQYGPDSARRHLTAGRAAGFTTTFAWLDGFGLDLDTPRDLAIVAAGTGMKVHSEGAAIRNGTAQAATR